jgi:hypothetical protein
VCTDIEQTVRPPPWPRLERYFSVLRDRPAALGVLDLPLA